MSADNQIATVLLRDVTDGVAGNIKVNILTESPSEHGALSLTLHPEGYNEYEGEFAPILLERQDGKLRLIVWADINDEEPTHIIDLEGAKETNRLSDEALENLAAVKRGESMPLRERIEELRTQIAEKQAD